MANDRVRVRGESAWIEGRVVEETSKVVAVEVAGVRREVPAWTVAEVERGERDGDLDEALARLGGGDAAGAVAACARALGGERAPWVAPQARFALAVAHRLDARTSGRADAWRAAREASVAFREKHGGHFHDGPAAFIAGEAAIEMGDAEAAQGLFASLADGGHGPAWALLGRYGGGLVALARGDREGALATFDRVIADGTSRDDGLGGEAARLALVGKVRALRAAGKVEAAVAEAAEALSDEDFARSGPTAAMAANEAGEAVLAKGDEPEHALAALPFFLRVVRHHPAEHAEQARALGLAVRALKRLETESAKEARAHLAATLAARYPTSRWAEEAGKG